MNAALRPFGILLAAGLLAAAPAVLSTFAVTLMNYIGIGALVAVGLVLLTGIGGLTSFGQAAFVGVAAYSTAWATTAGGVSPWLGLPFALFTTGLAALLIGAVTLRLGGHFLPLSTIAWGISIFYLFGNFEALGSHTGLSGIPPVSIGAIALIDSRAVYWLIWAAVGAGALFGANLLDSRQGRAVRALRGGPVLMASVGIDPFRTRLVIFLIAALYAGLAGWLYAHMSRFVSPAPFEIKPSIEYLLMALVGGASHIVGALVGAGLVTLLKNWLQDVLPHVTSNAAQYEQIAFAVILIVIMHHARGGLVPMLTRFLPRVRRSAPVGADPLPRRTLPERGQTVLRVDQAVRRFGGLVAVDKVSFELRAGEILGLIGPNGAGKSTMFNLLTGALRASSGRIEFLGQDITRMPQRRIAALGVARTFQHVKLRPAMTLVENVMLGAHLRTGAGWLSGGLRLDRAEEARARADAYAQLARVGLADKAEDLAGNLPLGQQRILEVARALAADPVMIVLDEPAAGLRRKEKEALAALLSDLRREGLAILVVEHDMDFVMGLVDRLVVMVFGARIAEGEPAAIRRNPDVQAAYLGGVA
ncbi:branched-chain amino acid ABC transporter ATP-binding protein/permease [Prosthecodimorpha staleyi]|uniref:Branched-chain amino acid ABC transporter ATP-binding protein/permease n=1 Tax=Prosthecodimorpha staleyi TaxID=2840188 RepID=A0A947GD38_9HYPH|nr:branched-chain amino acid ABC transporter ATP-binding protein/permease [Prosthecodimorpha staleyi]MBT9287885.1 branched-chain amino acid ABC transporter ATP-binding protein/permease [Prosthecodimorpha staleyi]